MSNLFRTFPCFLTSSGILKKFARYRDQHCDLCSRYGAFPNQLTRHSQFRPIPFAHSSEYTDKSRGGRTSRIVVVMADSASRQNASVVTGELDHVAMRCKGPAMELALWYAETVGFEAVNFDEYKAGSAHFPSVRVNPGTILDFFEPENDNSSSAISSGSHMCFSFSRDSFDTLITRLGERGVDLTEKKKRSGARGQGWSVYAIDPEGNHLEFRYYD